MREIKFRAWDYVAKEMLVVKQLEFGRNQSNDIWAHLSDGHILNQQHFELMQYTGLKDKNGKQIYEGDIIRFKWSDEWISPVFWDDKYGWTIRTIKVWKYNLSLHIDTVEVIGNIYENKELLNDNGN